MLDIEGVEPKDNVFQPIVVHIEEDGPPTVGQRAGVNRYTLPGPVEVGIEKDPS
ncbi:MAG: hypothetical protein H6560_11865 [Lewinellaceae bacterium]|nr:hypothetical protein [Lewinellaceae bacterium]